MWIMLKRISRKGRLCFCKEWRLIVLVEQLRTCRFWCQFLQDSCLLGLIVLRIVICAINYARLFDYFIRFLIGINSINIFYLIFVSAHSLIFNIFKMSFVFVFNIGSCSHLFSYTTSTVAVFYSCFVELTACYFRSSLLKDFLLNLSILHGSRTPLP
jgi:hypothetical protein